MSETNKIPSPIFIKPIVTTKFHIDFSWWHENDHSWRSSLINYLCEEHKAFYADNELNQMVDSVDVRTGQVTQKDQLQDTIIQHCARKDDFILPNTALTDAVFRVFLSNGNTPLDCKELGAIISKQPEIILKTISGPRIYRGIRPVN